MEYIEKTDETECKEFVASDFVANSDNKTVWLLIEPANSLIREAIDKLEKYEQFYEKSIKNMVENNEIEFSFYCDYDPFIGEVELMAECEGQSIPYDRFEIKLNEEEQNRLINVLEKYCMEEIKMTCKDYLEFQQYHEEAHR